jgi:DNA transformation protein
MSAADLVQELFAPLGPIRVKRMFGGAGIYAGEVMFGLIADDFIHVKADAALAADLEAEGSGPFVFTLPRGPKAGKRIAMSYWRLPDSALDDADQACVWGRRALDVARAAAQPKKPKKAALKRP